jgi:serine/threonine-protein kinase HipA
VLNLVSAGKGVSLHYGPEWLASGFALSEDLPLTNTEFMPQGRLGADAPRAVGAVDDARPDRWGEKVIRFVDKPQRLSLMEYMYYAGDDRFGALGVSTAAAEYTPRALGPLPRLEDAQQLSEIAAKVELATMKLAALAGISVAATQVVRLSGLHAVAIRRFDRTVGAGLRFVANPFWAGVSGVYLR